MGALPLVHHSRRRYRQPRQLDAQVVQGNHDAAIFAIAKRSAERAGPVSWAEWTFDQLNESQLSFFAVIPTAESTGPLTGVDMCVSHRSVSLATEALEQAMLWNTMGPLSFATSHTMLSVWRLIFSAWDCRRRSVSAGFAFSARDLTLSGPANTDTKTCRTRALHDDADKPRA